MRQALAIAASALCLALVPAAAQALDMVTAFRDGCAAKSGDYAASQAEVERLGWTRAAKNDTPELARVITLAEQALEPGMQAEMVIYARTSEGRRYHLVLTLMNLDGGPISSCYLYDFKATGPLDRSALEAWLGVPAKVEGSGGIVGMGWDASPALPRMEQFKTIFVPASHPLATAFFPGVAMTITTPASVGVTPKTIASRAFAPPVAR